MIDTNQLTGFYLIPRYNCGCGLAAVGEFAKAEEELISAESQARQFLAEEGETAEDIEQEVGIIRVIKTVSFIIKIMI